MVKYFTDMEELIELVGLYKKSKLRTRDLLAVLIEPGSQMDRLFLGITSGQVRTDKQILAAFPEFKSSTTRAAALKYKLKERLVDGVLMLDFDEPAYADRQTAYHECQRKYASAMVLIGRGLKRNGIEVLETLLRQTLRFEFTELNLSILRALSRYYVFIEGEKKKYLDMECLLSQQEVLHDMERRAEYLYKDLINDFVRRKAGKEQLAPKAKAYMEEVKPWMARYESYWLQMMCRLLEITWYDILGNYLAVAHLAEESIRYFAEKPYESSSAFQAFHNHLFEALFHLRHYERCHELVSQYGDRFEVGSFNWFKLQELLFLQAMFTGTYEEAARIYKLVVKRPEFPNTALPVRELWKIFEAFLTYLVVAGQLAETVFSGVFRAGRFINEIQMYAQDKSGMNVSVMLLPFLFDLLEERFSACLERIDALAKYRLRYLSDPASRRSHCFVRLLEQLPKCGFSADLVESRTRTLVDELRAHPIIPGQNYEQEVIPYEILWDLVSRALTLKKAA